MHARLDIMKLGDSVCMYICKLLEYSI